MRQKIWSFRLNIVKEKLSETLGKNRLFSFQYDKFYLYVQLSYTKISYLRKNTHLQEDAAFLHFRLKES